MDTLYFTEDHELFRETIKTYLNREIVPHLDKWEKEGKVDRDAFLKMGEMGFFGLDTPEEDGGMGTDFMYTTVLVEECGRIGTLGFSLGIIVHTYLAMNYLNKAASPYLKERYLKPSLIGEKVGSLAMTEPFAGSDLKGILTTAAKEGDYYIVNGSKTFISNGHYGDYIITAVKTGEKISLLLIDNNMEGVMTTKLDKMGLRCSDTAEISFNNVKVPANHLLGEEGKGFYCLMESLQVERLTCAQLNVGAIDYAINLTMQYIGEREAFGQKINEFQVLRHKMVEMITEYEAWKNFTYHTSYRFSKGEFVVKECSMLKLKTGDLLNQIAYDCLQMFGGYGFMEEYPICRLYRDVRASSIYAGSSEIMKEIIAKIVIDNVEYKPVYKQLKA